MNEQTNTIGKATSTISYRRQGRHGTYLNLYPGSGYDPTVYERPVLTVDICVFRNNPFNGQPQILMIQRGQAPFKNRWAFPGGYVDIANGESIQDAALRELREETGIADIGGNLKQFKTYASDSRDPRWYTCDVVYYYVMSQIEAVTCKPHAGDDAAKVKWESVNLVRNRKLAFDHNEILEDVLKHNGWAL